jgi:hypothetical protein
VRLSANRPDGARDPAFRVEQAGRSGVRRRSGRERGGTATRRKEIHSESSKQTLAARDMRESPGSKTIPHWSPRAACARTLRKQRAATSRFLCHVKFFLHFFQNFLRRRNVFGIRRRSRVSKLQLLGNHGSVQRGPPRRFPSGVFITRLGRAIKSPTCAGAWVLKIARESLDLLHSICARSFACAAANRGS